MKFTRFLCTAALAVGIAGSIVSGGAPDFGSGPASARTAAPCDGRPGDTEWTNPASHCPPAL